MSDNRGLLPVTQADRDAAADLAEPISRNQARDMRLAYYDACDSVQAFARHRLAAAPIAAPGGEVERNAKWVRRAQRLIRTIALPLPNDGRQGQTHIPIILYVGNVEEAHDLLSTTAEPSPTPASVEERDADALVEIVQWWDTGLLHDGALTSIADEIAASGKANDTDKNRQAEQAVIARVVRSIAAIRTGERHAD